MKSRMGLAISVGLNLGLVGVLLWMWFSFPRQRVEPAAELIVLNGQEDATNDSIEISYPARGGLRFGTNVPLPRFTWRAIESPDYRRYISNLRTIGCPEKTIRDIIIADVNELYAGRLREFAEERSQEFRYWETGAEIPGVYDEELELKIAELDRERRALLEELLDVEITSSVQEFVRLRPMEQMLSFLSADKRSQIVALEEEFASRQQALLSGGQLTEETPAQLRALKDEKAERLSAILTPEEKLLYELTLSPLAMNMRLELAGFEPTAEEFQEIYEIRKQFSEEQELALAEELLVELSGDDILVDQQIDEASAREEAALLDALGPQRFAQYKRSQDPAYQQLLAASRVNEVSPITANRIYELQQIARVEQQNMMSDQSLTPEQKEIALQGIREETARTIRENLGNGALQAFQEWNERRELEAVGQ